MTERLQWKQIFTIYYKSPQRIKPALYLFITHKRHRYLGKLIKNKE